MDITIIILIAISLAIDCFAISICLSSTKKLRYFQYFNIPIHFGFFQFFMVLIGYYFGLAFKIYIERIDHWVAFILLFILGIKMILNKSNDKCVYNDNLTEFDIISFSIATSIDALIIGLTFSIINGGILINAIIIGIFSLGLSIIGLILGNRIRKFNFKFIERIAGLVLIGIGLKIFIIHVFNL